MIVRVNYGWQVRKIVGASAKTFRDDEHGGRVASLQLAVEHSTKLKNEGRVRRVARTGSPINSDAAFGVDGISILPVREQWYTLKAIWSGNGFKQASPVRHGLKAALRIVCEAKARGETERQFPPGISSKDSMSKKEFEQAVRHRSDMYLKIAWPPLRDHVKRNPNYNFPLT